MKRKTVTVLSMASGIVLGGLLGIIFAMRRSSGEKEKWEKLSEKHLKLMLLLNQWIYIKQQGKSVIDYFHKENINSIAIYGMSYIGERLYDELKNSDVTVKYAIDNNADRIYSEVELISPDEDLEEVDAVIVTPITFFPEIEKKMSKKVNCPIISLKDILYHL